jgi:hypothetical protein
LEEVVEIIKVGKCFVQGVSRSWNIPLNSLCDHLNQQGHKKTMGPGGVFINMEMLLLWFGVLAMQEASIFVNM